MQRFSEEFERILTDNSGRSSAGMGTAGMLMSLLMGHDDFELSINGTEIALTNIAEIEDSQ